VTPVRATCLACHGEQRDHKVGRECAGSCQCQKRRAQDRIAHWLTARWFAASKERRIAGSGVPANARWPLHSSRT
jgi:hypothetical protein